MALAWMTVFEEFQANGETDCEMVVNNSKYVNISDNQ